MGLTAEQEHLWQAFRNEVRDREDWDHDFIGSPYDPGRPLRVFVDQVGAAAVPTLLSVLSSADDTWTYWACVGLEWLGPLAGPEAAAALEARVWCAGDKEPYWPAAVALESVYPERARANHLIRNRRIVGHVVSHHLARGMASACDFVEWVVAHEDAETIQQVIGNWELRDAVTEECPPRLADVLRQLRQAHRSDGVRAAAADLLAAARVPEPAAGLIDAFAGHATFNLNSLDRVASHPDSWRLVGPLVEAASLIPLATLLSRRRCAGWWTDPAPIRPLLRDKLERPKREWRYEEHDVHYAALCLAELRDGELIPSLVGAVVPENGGFAWGPLQRAFRALGDPAHEALEREWAACPAGERRERLSWMRGMLDQRPRTLEEMLGDADDTWRRGRIEPSIGGAFRAYGDVLLTHNSARAAFQLAWIDRAFGSEVGPERVRWIRSLGFRDDELLTELGTPLENPLNGSRSAWDGGEFQKKDSERAARAFEAGLPSLANHWNREERFERAAAAHLARVGKAAASIA